MGTTYFIWRIAGWGAAAEMCLTGDRITAAEAHRTGLVNHVYDGMDGMTAAAREIADQTVSTEPGALRIEEQ